jgi:hemerythrin superfamily protein
MDAIRLIKSDHSKVEALFKKLEDAEFKDAATIAEVVKELTVHAAIEEAILYPRARQAGAGEEVKEGVEEHGEIKDLLAKVKQADVGSTDMEMALVELIAVVRHHAEEEESELLPELRKAVSESELEQLGAELETAKAEQGINPLIDLTRDELYERATEADIEGRSDMTKDELISALTDG